MPTLEISQETYDKIKDQLGEDEKIDLKSLADMIGKKFFFRTVTYHVVGKVVNILGNIIQLEDSSWVADSGRFMQAIKEGKLNEVEPVGKGYLNSQSLVDFYPWRHDLPKEQK